MQIIGNFVSGLMSVLKVIGGPMLYRYPYRTSSEGLRSDWANIGQDIKSVIGKLESESRDGE